MYEKVIGVYEKDTDVHCGCYHRFFKQDLIPVISVKEHKAKMKEAENIIKQLRSLVSFVANGGKPSDWLMESFPKEMIK